MSVDHKMPVFIVGGFLGAGKTSLLQRILRSKEHGYRFAVIVNEFADVGIDGDLVKDVDGVPTVEMTNGCACCTLIGDLETTLRNWAGRNDIDGVIIETTGLADPGQMAHLFMAAGPVRDSFALQRIIVVVDAKNHALQAAEGPLWMAQVVVGHVVVINKVDLATPIEVSALRQLIDQQNPLATVHETSQAQVDLGLILNQDDSLVVNADTHRHDHHDHASCDHVHGHCEHDHHEHHHDSTAPYASVCLDELGEVDPDRFNNWFGGILATVGTQLARTKGILSLPGRDTQVVVQSVYEQTTVQNGSPWPEGIRRNKMVIIGRREVIDADSMAAGFRSCLIEA